jgi:acetylornithine deacetylase
VGAVLSFESTPLGGEAIRILADLIALPSVNPSLVAGGAGEEAVARYAAAYLERAGLSVKVEEVAPHRPNVVGIVRGQGNGRTLLYNGHLDTVGVDGMTISPFEPSRVGDRIHGRGALDMKGGIAAFLAVAASLARLNPPLAGDLIVAATVDEEYGSSGMAALLERVRADAAVVCEPTGLDVCVANRGFVWLEVETRGRAAHGALFEEGVDAIAMMGPILTGITALDASLASRRHPLLGRGSVHAGLITGGREWSTYPGRCTLQVERRTLPDEHEALARSELEAIVARAAREDGRVDAAVRVVMARDPCEVAEGEPLVDLLGRVAEEVIGRRPRLTGMVGWPESALLNAAGIPAVNFGPGGGGAHADMEYVHASEVAACAIVLRELASRFCGEPVSA